MAANMTNVRNQKMIGVTCVWLKLLNTLLLKKTNRLLCLEHNNLSMKIDQLDVTCFIISLFTAQHVSNVSTFIFRSLRLVCGFISCVVLLWFVVCWCYGVVRLGWCGILMQAEAQTSRKLLKMNELTFETCWAVYSEIIKQVTSSWSVFIELSRWCTVQ